MNAIGAFLALVQRQQIVLPVAALMWRIKVEEVLQRMREEGIKS